MWWWNDNGIADINDDDNDDDDNDDDDGDDNYEDDDDGDDDKDRAIHLPARHLLHMPLGNKFLKLWNLESEKICQTLLGFDDIENKCSVSFILTRMSTWRIQSKILRLATLKILAAAYWLCFLANRATSNWKENVRGGYESGNELLLTLKAGG